LARQRDEEYGEEAFNDEDIYGAEDEEAVVEQTKKSSVQ